MITPLSWSPVTWNRGSRIQQSNASRNLVQSPPKLPDRYFRYVASFRHSMHNPNRELTGNRVLSQPIAIFEGLWDRWAIHYLREGGSRDAICAACCPAEFELVFSRLHHDSNGIEPIHDDATNRSRRDPLESGRGFDELSALPIGILWRRAIYAVSLRRNGQRRKRRDLSSVRISPLWLSR